jgi:antitoxin YefM
VALEIEFSQFCQEWRSLCEAVSQDGAELIVLRGGDADLAIIPASEWRTLQESVYLLRSQKNANHLFDSIRQADEGTLKAISIDDL